MTAPTTTPARNAAGNGGYTTGRRMAASRLKLTYIGSVRAELTKLTSIKSTYWLLGVAALLIVAGGAISAWSYKAMAFMDYNVETGEMVTLTTPKPVEAAYIWTSTVGMITTASLVFGIFGVMSITSEYTNLTIQSGFVANPRRGMYLAAKATVAGALSLLASLVGVGLSWAAVRGILSGIEITPLTQSQRLLPVVCILGGPVASMLMTIMSLGLGAICRSTVGGVFALIGLWTILPSMLSIAAFSEKLRPAFQSLSNCMPSSALGDFLNGMVGNAMDSGLSIGVTGDSKIDYFDPTWWQSGLILLAWAAVAYAIGLLVIRRSDVK
ncbi:permease of ABC transporter system [Bifidobacterium vespertilionis]|uniref:permease of ABC transporter system n=1 Tax=Bifidobacterium vespertilionis TaxID=2562524 RepID=UPI001BDD3F6B|nr:permease of ABC transporter system [Bifidobacterium vespertilionis]MBT1179735.1 permease of ABC transporter system [Bifidobacterium vespertilionis]